MLNPVTPFPIDADREFDDLADAILNAFGEVALWKPQDGSEPVQLRAYVRRSIAREDTFGRATVSAKVSAVVAAADVQGILQGDLLETKGVEYEIGEPAPDGSAFVRLLLREPGR